MSTRIMVVDDETLIQQLLTYQLGSAGYEVCAVQSGREALARLMAYQPDLILLDVMMPDMSGWDTCRQIRTCSRVPIIMLTAKSSDEDVVTGLTAGADDYIAKPYSLNQLLARVEAVLRRARSLNTSTIKSGGGIDRTPDSAGQRTETAYHAQPGLAPTLPRPSVVVEPSPVPESTQTGLGQRLSEARKMRGMTLYQAEMACGIRWEFLQALEYEHFDYIPRPQLRRYLRNYSMYLGVDLSDFARRSTTPRSTPSSARRSSTWSLWLLLAAILVFVALVAAVGLQLV